LSLDVPVKIKLKALKEYIDRIGGTIIIDNSDVDIIIPVEVEEVSGGIQYRIKGRIEGNDVVIEDCVVSIEATKVANIDVRDLVPWLKYISEYFE